MMGEQASTPLRVWCTLVLVVHVACVAAWPAHAPMLVAALGVVLVVGSMFLLAGTTARMFGRIPHSLIALDLVYQTSTFLYVSGDGFPEKRVAQIVLAVLFLVASEVADVVPHTALLLVVLVALSIAGAAESGNAMDVVSVLANVFSAGAHAAHFWLKRRERWSKL